MFKPLRFITVSFISLEVLFHGSKISIKFVRIEKGIRLGDGAFVSSSNPAWANVFITAKTLEKTHDEGD